MIQFEGFSLLILFSIINSCGGNIIVLHTYVYVTFVSHSYDDEGRKLCTVVICVTCVYVQNFEYSIVLIALNKNCTFTYAIYPKWSMHKWWSGTVFASRSMNHLFESLLALSFLYRDILFLGVFVHMFYMITYIFLVIALC